MNEKQKIRVTQWHGMANYQCGLCPFATLDPQAIEAHMKKAHGVRARAPKPESTQKPAKTAEK